MNEVSQVYANRIESALPGTMSLVREPLTRMEAMLGSRLRSEVPIIDEMVRCGAATGGKRFRPVLLFLAAQATGDVTDQHVMLATSVELIHAATLVHDDIIDQATTRRHVSTINSRWGNQGAVLFGDYLFTQAFYLASLTGSAAACQIIGAATNQVCEGELRQSDAAGNFETTVDEYFTIISKKTGALCGCATQLGACLNSNGDVARQWSRVGNRLGLAFQIVDDVLDFTGDAASCGKTLGTDLATAKPTLPLLLALQTVSAQERADWLQLLGNGTCVRAEVREWLLNSGAIEESIRRSRMLVEEALVVTSNATPAVAAAFEELGTFLLARTH
jgi:octaprenyl-diphosphate synthase